MRVVGILVARLGSSRLPGKMMYPMGNKIVIEHVLDRAQESKELDEVVLATTDVNHDTVLAKRLEKYGEIRVHHGSESDVLGRVLQAADESSADVIVRICGDNPLLSPRCIDAVVRSVTSSEADYVATNLDGSYPKGLDVEAFTVDSFREVNQRAESKRYREHVTLYYKEHPGEFIIRNISSNDVFERREIIGRNDLRLTLDTAEDYELLEIVYLALGNSDEIVDLHEAVSFIDENELANLNEGVEQRTFDETNG